MPASLNAMEPQTGDTVNRPSRGDSTSHALTLRQKIVAASIGFILGWALTGPSTNGIVAICANLLVYVFLAAGVTSIRTSRLIVAFLMSCAFIGASLYTILADGRDNRELKMAYGALGAVAGFWLPWK
jgi:hypothetical protein